MAQNSGNSGNSNRRGYRQDEDQYDNENQNSGNSGRGRQGGSNGYFRGSQGNQNYGQAGGFSGGIINYIDQTIEKLQDAKEALIGGGSFGGGYSDYGKSGGRSQNMTGYNGGRDHGLRNEDGSVDQRQFNEGRQNFSGGSDDESDDRTLAGREHDADDYGPDEIQEMIEGITDEDLNENGSVDKRSKVGRVLNSAGMLDDEGFIIRQQGRNSGGRSGGRSSGGNSGNRSTSSGRSGGRSSR